jgi:hypothetical protein
MKSFMVVGISACLGLSQLQHSPFNERPADVTIHLSASRGKYDGTYRLTEVARVCGEVPGDRNFSGLPSFIVQMYPDNNPTDPAKAEIMDVTFGSTKLVGTVTTTNEFHLSVGVKSPKIGQPPAYVLDTQKSYAKGTATLTTTSPGTTVLKITGSVDIDGVIDFTLTCKPKGKK